jgi:hypothetical protein
VLRSADDVVLTDLLGDAVALVDAVELESPDDMELPLTATGLL